MHHAVYLFVILAQSKKSIIIGTTPCFYNPAFTAGFLSTSEALGSIRGL